jgi:hypothetical protein
LPAAGLTCSKHLGFHVWQGKKKLDYIDANYAGVMTGTGAG